MHPLLAIPVALVGFLLGRRTATSTETKSGKPEKIGDVTLGQWERFVAALAAAPKEHVGRRRRLGAFQMDARRLADVGVMRNARKLPDGSWTGDWMGALTETQFLGSMPLQYAAFVRSMRAAAPKVSPLVGSLVDGKPATLSGLLGVVHVAGERGVRSFVEDAEVRRKFPGTSEAFVRTNGIF